MLRFAISPTADLNVGDLRTALLTHIAAMQRDEQMIIRIEDLDTARNIEDADKEIVGLLGLFGIEAANVIHQSSHLRYHRTFAIQMLQEKRAFNCFCTPAELDRKHQEAEAGNVAYRYDGTCARLTPEQTIDNENPFTVRLRKPDTAVTFNDVLKGESIFAPDQIDNVVLLNAEKVPTTLFASAVDDMLSDITFIVREERAFETTPAQIAIRHAIGYGKAIGYAHIPVLDNANYYSVKRLIEAGYLPAAIVSYLLSACIEPSSEAFTLDEAVERLDITRLSKLSNRFDMNELQRFNQAHLKHMDAKELSRYVGFADDDIGNLARLYIDEAPTLEALRARIEPIFAKKEVPEALCESADAIRDVLKEAPYFETFEALRTYLHQHTGLKEDTLAEALRYLMTGAEAGPDLDAVYPHLKNYLGEIVK
jgi:glutamyl-tRNA synthetase